MQRDLPITVMKVDIVPVTRDTECGFCFARLAEMHDPRALPCGHTQCTDCIEINYLDSKIRMQGLQVRTLYEIQTLKHFITLAYMHTVSNARLTNQLFSLLFFSLRFWTFKQAASSF